MRSFQIHFSQSQNHFLLAFSSYAILFFLFEYFLGQPLSQSYKLVLFESLFFALLGYMMNFSTAFLKVGPSFSFSMKVQSLCFRRTPKALFFLVTPSLPPVWFFLAMEEVFFWNVLQSIHPTRK